MTDQPGSYDVHMNYTYNCAPLIEDTRSVLTVISISFKYYVSLKISYTRFMANGNNEGSVN